MKKTNVAFFIDDLRSVCGLTRNLLENVKWMDKDRFNIFIYALDASKMTEEFKDLDNVRIRDIRFNKFNPFSYIRIISFLRSDDIEIVHSYPFVSNLIGPLLAKIAGTKKIITSVHSEVIIKSRFLAGLSYGLSDNIIVVSGYLKEFLRKAHNLDSRKIKIVYNKIDLDLFKPPNDWRRDREKIGLSEDTLVVMTVSKLRWERGHKYLIRTIEKVEEGGRNFKFVIIGDGPLEEEIKSMSRDLGVEEKILFMGYREKVWELLSCCDIFVLPSISEGVGMIAILEAMAMKKPVITTPVGSMPELVKNGENGFLVKPADPDAILSALNRLADDGSLRQEMGAKGRQIVESNFNARDKVRELERIYT